MVRRFLTRVQKPVVIDADGLNALAGHNEDTIAQITAPSVMTPHSAELARLLDLPTEQINAQRLEKAQEWAKYLFTTLVIKGNPTIIAQEGKPVWLNPTGNDGMATAGSGDVLTGLIAGFLAQGCSTWDAARLGAFIHGSSGDSAAEVHTARAMIATDIEAYIPDTFWELENVCRDEQCHQKEMDFSYTRRQLGERIFHLTD